MNLQFKLNIAMRCDRPVDMLEDNLYPGVCKMAMSGKPVLFDFKELSWYVDEDDKCLVHLEHQFFNYINEDVTKEMCHDVDSVDEFIFMTDTLNLHPISIEEMVFVFTNEEIRISDERFKETAIFNHLENCVMN